MAWNLAFCLGTIPFSLFVIECLVSDWIFLDKQKKNLSKKGLLKEGCIAMLGALKRVPKSGKDNICEAPKH